MFQHGLLKNATVHAGQAIWQTDDPQLSRQLKATYSGKSPHFQRPIDIDVQAAVGKPMRVDVRFANHSFTIETLEPLAEANKHAIDDKMLTEQLGRLGGSPFVLRSLTAHIEGRPMVPFSVLGLLRKEMLHRLETLQATLAPKACSSDLVTKRMLSEAVVAPAVESSVASLVKDSPTLHVLCRSLSQLDIVLAHGIQHVYADFHDIRQYREAVEKAHQANASIYLATLRIQKPGEMGLFSALGKQAADGWLVRNLAALRYAKEHQIPSIGDFSLNVTNPLTAQWLIEQGVSRCTASYDLNRDQLIELVAAVPTSWLEVVIHQHIPMFHMEHCVFCTVLSPGTNKSNCGRPCDRHEVTLEDRIGVKHVLHADIGCRNTLYNGVAQSGAEAVPYLLQRGIRQFRIELLHDAATDQIQQLIELYRELIQGQIAGSEVWKALRADNRVGVTRGTLEHPRNPLAIL